MPASEAILTVVREWIVKADHDLEDLQDRLTEYASAARYPESGLDISLTAARQAVALARRVRREVRRKLPKAALPQRKK